MALFRPALLNRAHILASEGPQSLLGCQSLWELFGLYERAFYAYAYATALITLTLCTQYQA